MGSTYAVWLVVEDYELVGTGRTYRHRSYAEASLRPGEKLYRLKPPSGYTSPGAVELVAERHTDGTLVRIEP